MQPGLPNNAPPNLRQAWLLNHTALWNLGGWLWLLALFSWMVLLIVLTWSYLPAHRVARMLQSGLMIIAAVLQIAGVIIWMHVLPALFLQTDLTNSLLVVVDTLALSLLSAGCFMGGATTAWLTVNLFQEKVLPQFWLIFPLLAGLCATVAGLLMFNRYLLGSALLCWLIGGFWLSTRRRLPSLFSELP